MRVLAYFIENTSIVPLPFYPTTHNGNTLFIYLLFQIVSCCCHSPVSFIFISISLIYFTCFYYIVSKFFLFSYYFLHSTSKFKLLKIQRLRLLPLNAYVVVSTPNNIFLDVLSVLDYCQLSPYSPLKCVALYQVITCLTHC